MADQNNYYPQQPQYIDPQAQNPFGQPQYVAAPAPANQPAAPANEPEVIIQEIGFADYGFGEGDSISAGHDFGNIMEDDNKEPEDEFNAFNSQTPNFDPAAVEAAGRKLTDEDKAMFTSMTPNLDLNAVEQASKSETDFDRSVFSNATAVEDMQQTVSENPTFDAATAAFEKSENAPSAPVDFLASMKSKFASMNGQEAAPDPAPVPVIETPAPVVETPAPAPVPEPAPEPAVPVFTAPAPAPAPVPAAEPEIAPEDDLIPEPLAGMEPFPAAPAMPEPPVTAAPEIPSAPVQPVQPAQPDTVTNATSYATIHDVTTPVPPEQKDAEYWENINKMLGNFEQKPAQPAPEPAAEPVTSAPVIPEAEIGEPAAPEEEAKSGFPFSESAQANDLVPEAQISEEVYEPEEEGEEEEDDEEIELFVDKKAAKAEAKAEKARAKAEKRAVDNRTLLQKIFPSRGDTAADKAVKCIAIFTALALIFCIVFFGATFIKSKISQKNAGKLAAMLAAGETGNVTWNEIYGKYPGLQFPSGMQIKFADLYAINQDLAGWIKIPGLGIDYPVVQTSDDTFYQSHDFYKQNSKDGSIFLSSKNQAKDELDQNTVIYGHAIKKSGRMFSNLHSYKDSATFIKNPVIEFSTLYGDYKFKIYSVFITNGASAQDNGFILDYTFANLATTESLAGYIAEINQRRLYSTGVDILPTDKLICLSTASFEFENARLVVVGRMLRAGESEEIDASKVEVNKNPRYPQAWYDANKVTNPYDKYSHWKPAY